MIMLFQNFEETQAEMQQLHLKQIKTFLINAIDSLPNFWLEKHLSTKGSFTNDVLQVRREGVTNFCDTRYKGVNKIAI